MVRTLGRDLVHRYLNAAGNDWPELDEFIASTADLIEQRLLENPIPQEFAAIFSVAICGEARAEAARVRGAFVAGGCA